MCRRHEDRHNLFRWAPQAPIWKFVAASRTWYGWAWSFCIMIAVGLLTPPVGLNLYMLQDVTGEPMRDGIVGSARFIVLQFAMVAALYYWPDIAMYLPRRVMGLP